jgi:outer membrane protein assembly factor BamB
MVNDQGIVTSFNPATGDVMRQSRIPGVVDNFFASPVAADSKVFLVSESGKVAVLKPDGSISVLAVNPLDDSVYATPAIAEGRIYIRTASALYSFGSMEHKVDP